MELKTENLVKCYGKKAAVRNVSLTLSEGIYGLLGENGAGKTTLMGLLCGIQQPTHGKITLNGRTIEALGADYRKMLGYLPQNFGYYPEFKVWDFLLYVAALKGLSRAKAEEKSGEMLKVTGLMSEKAHKIKNLSGGMKRRLGIAQAMLNEPEILILDEPSAGLDLGERRRFGHLIQNFSKGRIILISTHIVSDVEKTADRIIMMKAGRVIYAGENRENLEDFYFDYFRRNEE